jgi:hypothetical protein
MPHKQKIKDAYLLFSHDAMQFYKPPKTRRKPTDTETSCYETQEYNVEDGIRQPDEDRKVQEIHIQRHR